MLERMEMFLTSILDAAWVMEQVLVTLAWVILCHGIPRQREHIRRWMGNFVLLFLGMVAADVGMIVVLPRFIPPVWSLTMGVVSMVYLQLCSDYRRGTSLVLWCSQFAGMVALTVMAGQLSILTGEYLAKGAAEGLVRSLMYLCMIPLALYLRRFNFSEFETVPRSGMALIIAGDVCIVGLYLMESMWMRTDYQMILMVIGSHLSLFTMVIFAIYAMYAMCREQTEVIALQAERQRLIAEQENMKMVQASLEDLRCVRHDLKNQYAYMQILLDSGRYSELSDYFRQVAENLPQGLNYVDCGNTSMNTILNMEIGKAKQRDIPVQTNLVVPPVLPFPEDDLCAIVANLMDNAIEECGRFLSAGGEQGHIRLDIYPQKSYLFIMCRNRTDRKTLQRHRRGLRTTKSDEKLHGYGTRIVTKTAEKYNGAAEFTLEDGEFVAKVLLDMMEGKPYADQNRAV